MKARPWGLALLCVVLAASQPACFAFFALGDEGAVLEEPPSSPEIDLWIDGPDNDSIDVYLDGPAAVRGDIAEGVAAWLGFPGAIAHDSEYTPGLSTVYLDSRLTRPGADDTWVLEFETTAMQRVLESTGYRAATLVICTPPVATRIRTTRNPTLGTFDTVCFQNGRGWTVRTSDAEPLRVRMTLVPKTAHYLAYAAGVLLGTVLLGALAWWIGDRLRHGPFLVRSAAAVAIGLIGGGFAAAGLGIVALGIGGAAGPADNLALARDFTGGGFAASIIFPGLIASAPGLIFGALLTRRRPWGDDIVPTPRSAPAPPGGPAAPGPPPLPWRRD